MNPAPPQTIGSVPSASDGADFLSEFGLLIVVVAVTIALVLAIFFVGTGSGGDLRKLRCANLLHREWTGKEQEDFDKFVHPKPRKELMDMFVISRSKKPKVCVECVAVAEQKLLRSQWLENGFLKYLNDWRKKVEDRPGLSRAEKNKMQITAETLTGLYRTARGFLGATRFLLKQPGVEFVLSEKFNQDPLESFFGNQRQMKGGNDAPSVSQFNNMNAAKLRSDQTLKVYGGNVRHMVSPLDMPEDDSPLPRKRPKTD